MSKFVVYASKSGNTKAIAERIAQVAGCELIPLNFLEKQGKNSSGNKEQEQTMYNKAIKQCKNAELVFVGTPVIAKQPHSRIRDFVNTVDAKRIAFFITYENNMGFALKEMKDSAEIRSIRVLGAIEYSNMKTGEIDSLKEPDKDQILKKTEKFTKDCLQKIK